MESNRVMMRGIEKSYLVRQTLGLNLYGFFFSLEQTLFSSYFFSVTFLQLLFYSYFFRLIFYINISFCFVVFQVYGLGFQVQVLGGFRFMGVLGYTWSGFGFRFRGFGVYAWGCFRFRRVLGLCLGGFLVQRVLGLCLGGVWGLCLGGFQVQVQVQGVWEVLGYTWSGFRSFYVYVQGGFGIVLCCVSLYPHLTNMSYLI